MQSKRLRIGVNKLSIRTSDIGIESTKPSRSVIFSTFSQGDSPIFLVNTSKETSFNFKHSLRFKDPSNFMRKPINIVEIPHNASPTKTRNQSRTWFSMYKDNISKSLTRKQIFYQLEGGKDHKQLSHLTTRLNPSPRSPKKIESYQKKPEVILDTQCLTINRLTGLNRTQQNLRKSKARSLLRRDDKEDPDYVFFKNKLISEYITKNPTE